MVARSINRLNADSFVLVNFILFGHAIIEVKKMYRDSDDRKTSASVIPIQNMVNGGGVIFFGEDSGFIDDPEYNEELRNEKIRKLSR